MANEEKSWKGAVEPAETSPSGNEERSWKGAIEPADPGGITPITVEVPPGGTPY